MNNIKKSNNAFVISFLMIIILALIYRCMRIDRLVEQLRKTNGKITSFYYLLINWVKNYQNEQNCFQCLKEDGYLNAAIYGIKELGERTYYGCKASGINVPFFIDKCGANEVFMDRAIPVINPNSDLLYGDKVDVIIVTAVANYDEISMELEDRISCPILSLEEVIYRRCN